jgi:hypothetical protein
VVFITREVLIQTLQNALESLPTVDGAWLGGSAAFGKLDPVVLVDKAGVVRAVPLDTAADSDEAQRRLAVSKVGFQLFQHLIKKEIARGRAAEALFFYQSFTLRPLVEALRIVHCPHRRMFHLRYLERDLPPDVYERICDLIFVRDLADLANKRDDAEQWFWEIVDAEKSLAKR